MSTLRIVGLFVVAGNLVTAVATAQEKRIKRSDLPPAVEKTVAEQSGGATIKGFSVEKEKGEILYEAEMKVSGHSKDVLINGSGMVVEVEEEVAIGSLSPEVQAGLHAKAGKGKIGRVESITKQGRLVAYEAHLTTEGKKSEVQVGPDGKPLDHEE